MAGRLNNGISASLCLFVVLCGNGPGIGHAAPVTGRAAPDSTRAGENVWRFAISPYLWMPGLQGQGSLRGEHGRFTLPFSKAIQNVNFFTMGNVTATYGAYGLFLDAHYLDLSKHMAFMIPSMGADASMRSTMLSLGGSYEAYAQSLGGETLFGTPQQLTIAPTVGVHWSRLKVRAWGEGYSVSKSADWTVPFVGMKASYDLDPRWTLLAEGDVGAWGRDWGIQAQTSLGYRMEMLGQQSLLRVGYRVIHQDNHTDELHWNVTQYGPSVGLTVWF